MGSNHNTKSGVRYASAWCEGGGAHVLSQSDPTIAIQTLKHK